MAYIEAIIEPMCQLCTGLKPTRRQATKRIRTRRNIEWGVACAQHAEQMLALADEAEAAANDRDAKAFRDHLDHHPRGGQN